MHTQKEVRCLTDANALKELQNGSEDALNYFIDAYSPYVTAIIHNIIGSYMDTADIEEVAADVFFALWRNAGKVYSVKGFLGTTARNMAKNRLRQLGHDLPLEEQLLVIDELTPETQIERKELNRAVKKAVLAMPQPDRDIFLRFYYYCQSLEDISRQMHLNLSTVKSRLRRGRARLKDALVFYLT